MASPDSLQDLDTRGVLRVPAALDDDSLSLLWSQVQPTTAAGTVANRSGVYGARALLIARPRLRQLLAELHLDDVAAHALGGPGFPIDALFFDKNSEINWAVPAHQDVVVPVPSSVTAASVRNLRTRHGATYGEPPVHVLEELVAIRVHFDDSTTASGGLCVLPGSHSRGRWSETNLRHIPPEAFRHYDCSLGDLLLMKPLVVHRSPRATRPVRRRVLHLLYAPLDGWHASLSRHAA
jgi:hypothetical protein